MKSKFLLKLLFLALLFSGVLRAQDWQPLGPNDDNWASFIEAEYIDLAFDNSGIPYLSYMDYDFDEKISVVRYDLATGKWSFVGDRGISGDYVEFTAIAIDQNDIPYIAYADDDLDTQLVVKYFDGTAWEDLGAPFTDTAEEVDLKIDASGNVLVAYQDDDTDEVKVQRYDGTSWTQIGDAVSNGYPDELYLEIASDGSLYFSFSAYDQNLNADFIYVYKLDTVNQVWIPYTTTGQGDDTRDTFMTLSPSDVPYISYEANNEIRVDFFDGTQWVQVSGTVPANNIYPDNPRIAFSASGELYLSFEDDHDQDADTNERISVWKYDSINATWQSMGIGISGSSTDYPSLVFNPDGELTIAYSANSLDSSAVVKFYDEQTGNWNTLGEVGFTGGEMDDVKTKFNSAGDLYAAYSDGLNDRKLSVMFYNIGTELWEYLGEPGFTPTYAGAIDLEFNEQDQPYVLFRDEFSAIMVYKYDGTNWVQVGNPGGTAPTEYLELDIAPNGDLFIAHQDNVAGPTVRKYDSAAQTWSTMSHTNLPIGNTNHIDVTVDAQGIPYLTSSKWDGASSSPVWKYNADTQEWDQIGQPLVSGLYDRAEQTALDIDNNGVLYAAYGYNGSLTVKAYDPNLDQWNLIGTPFNGSAWNMSFQISDTNTLYLGFTDNSTRKSAVRMFNTHTDTWDLVGSPDFTYSEVNGSSLAVYNDDKMATVYSSFSGFAKYYGNYVQLPTREEYTYTLSLNSVSGTYGGTPFTNQPLTMTFSNVTEEDVTEWELINNGSYQALFPNGRNVKITLGSILNDVPLDDLESNHVGIIAAASNGNMFLGSFFFNGTNNQYSSDRAFVGDFQTAPPVSMADRLKADWNSVANLAYTSQGFSQLPLTIGGLSLVIPANQNAGGGTWGVSVTEIEIVPTISVDHSLTNFTSCIGSPSDEQILSVSATDLIQDVVVTTSGDFEVSLTSGTAFSNSVTITASGNLSATDVYVRTSNTAVTGNVTGSLTITSTGATDEIINLTGVVNELPNSPVAPAEQIVCPDNTIADLEATVENGATLEWYNVSTGGTALDPTSVLVLGDTYYAQTVNVNGCASNRVAVLATEDLTADDTDNDGLNDACDYDDDNDGTPDSEDAFPLDPNEDSDTDDDGVGDNADMDSDNDGTNDNEDDFPLDSNEDTDTDGDGTGNNADSDDDNDGTDDEEDAFPLDVDEDTDTDGDGTGNNADLDDDGDGISDEEDAFPLDADEDTDTDGDGTGNNSDTDDDADGFTDQEEIESGTDPLDAESFPSEEITTEPVAETSKVAPAQAFTPNGDGNNDAWIIPGLENYPNNLVKVFNRWGHLVYEAVSYQNDWEGFYKNNREKLPSGSYLYVIDLGDSSQPIRGWIFINY
ncbi:T9SS type B sorting domain-containing protein [Maribacter cobaltidurans]|uniref:Uncharacterized protein n=1 Tax=Maribacter cobaltidurans TaxID=1178778 RepID=A0A223V7K7_9FLAO|nr:gliding motility-associated C-terminal domain-containing protein [Maribacter cobaltidurans]ASV30988.1 hypothetical protein CJ263_12600 [Maribacter cobaltidurans]GGD90287.1 hypothetical protein GCM10011412_30320 [Maribacter cobaltidurans]